MTPTCRRRRRAGRRPVWWLALVTVAVAASLLGQAAARRPTPAQHFFDWSHLQFPPAEYRARRDRLAADLAAHGGGIFLTPARLGRSDGFTFRQLDDFLYLTGLELPDAILAIDADRRQTILFAPAQDARFFEPTRRNDFPGRPLQADPALARASGIADIRPIGELAGALDAWVAAHRTLRVDAGGPDPIRPLALSPIQDWTPLQHFIAFLQRSRPSASIVNAYAPIARLRMVKSPAEIAVMRRAAGLTARSIAAASRRVRAGMDERGLEAAFEGACKDGGAQRLAFASIIKSGPNALWPWRIWPPRTIAATGGWRRASWWSSTSAASWMRIRATSAARFRCRGGSPTGSGRRWPWRSASRTR